jgi:type VI protein secretion system component VasF
MSIRDREVLEELRDDPELLALADAVVETQRLRRRTPIRALTAVAVAAAVLFMLILASPWD